MIVRGIRGAITVARDEPALILDATERLLREIVERNGFVPEDVASALFTVTPDLVSEFPAAAARRMGWTMVPLRQDLTGRGLQQGQRRVAERDAGSAQHRRRRDHVGRRW